MSEPSDILEADLRWREAEIGSLKLLVSRAAKDSVQHRALLRALWAMLYAHYEGYCKFVWDFYLQAVANEGRTRIECCSPLARFSLTKLFQEFRRNLDSNSVWELCSGKFSDWMNEPLTFEVPLDTKSNLWPNLLIENSTSIDLPSSQAAEHALRLRALVARRNDIAHGKKMVIPTLEAYQPYEDAAFLVMHELAVAVLERLEDKSYLVVAAQAE
jgi:hypothetical protein